MQKPIAVILLALIAALAIGGTYANKRNDETRVALAARSKTASERITTQGLVSPTEFQTSTRGKFATTTTFWVMAETDDWILLNGPRGTATCPNVLGEFGEVNAPDEAMSLASMHILAAGFKDKPLHIDVFVPRFRAEPAGLEHCIGFSYDLSTGMLKVGNKRIAYLAPMQPGLVGR